MTIEGYIFAALVIIGLAAGMVWNYKGMQAKEEENRRRRNGRKGV
jgi:hypothetical protein